MINYYYSIFIQLIFVFFRKNLISLKKLKKQKNLKHHLEILILNLQIKLCRHPEHQNKDNNTNNNNNSNSSNFSNHLIVSCLQKQRQEDRQSL